MEDVVVVLVLVVDRHHEARGFPNNGWIQFQHPAGGIGEGSAVINLQLQLACAGLFLVDGE